MRPIVLVISTGMLLAGSVRPAVGQTARESSNVFLSFSAPSRLTLHEPVAFAVHVQNSSQEEISADLGRNYFGSSKLTLVRPDGSSVTIDPSAPSRPDEAFVSGRIRLGAGERFTKETVLDRWLDFSSEGVYRLRISFEGAVQAVSNRALAVQRTATLVIQVMPRNEATLDSTADRLVRQMNAVSAEQAILAATKLAHMRDPVAVRHIKRALDSPGRRELDTIVIRGLERIDTAEARAALEAATGSAEPSTARAAIAALERAQAKRK